MQRSAHVTTFSLLIEIVRDRNRVDVGFNHRVERRIKLLNAVEITLHQVFGSDLAGSHRGLELKNAFLDKRKITSRERVRFKECTQATGQQCCASGCGCAQKTSAAHHRLIRTVLAIGFQSKSPVSE